MKFPHTVRFRALTAKIYGRKANYPFYRLAVRVAGKRIVRSFATFKETKAEANTKLREMAQGNPSVGLSVSAKESADALAIREAVQGFYRDTGRKGSALEAVTGYLATLRTLAGSWILFCALRKMTPSMPISWKAGNHGFERQRQRNIVRIAGTPRVVRAALVMRRAGTRRCWD